MFVDGGLGFPPGHGISFTASDMWPSSRGSVSLASDDPTTKPQIRHNFFEQESDLDGAVAGLRVALEIARQSALKPFTETPFEVPASESDADLRAFARRAAQSAYHPTGTCSIGSVVDAELRVDGVEGLRVVDASVIPTAFTNPNAQTIAIAERASDLIRNVAPLDPIRVPVAV
jgi:choline dehydrogenase-like flavoprotein